MRYDWGAFFDGRRNALTAGIRLAPSPKAAFTLDYEYNYLQNLGETQQSLRTHLTTGGIRLAANPRLQFSLFYQYNSMDQQGRWNARLAWEYRPLSFAYLVFNDNRFPTEGLNNQSAIAKVSFLRQF